MSLSLLSARPLQASLPSLTRALSSTATPRPNKRTSASRSSLSSLISLYHLSPTFLPLSPSSVDPTICHTFAPDSNSYGSQRPMRIHELLGAHEGLQISAIAHDVKRAFPDLSQTRLQAGAGNVMEKDGGPTYDKSFEGVFTRGSEPPMRKRWRRVMDRLHGTESGGQAGVGTLAEEGEDWGERVERMARETEREKERDAALESSWDEPETEDLRMVGGAGEEAVEESPRA